MSNDEINLLLMRAKEQLSTPLSDEEKSHHWSMKSKEAFLAFVVNYIDQFSSTCELAKIHEDSRHIARGMDHWGISSGALHELLSTIQRKIRDMHDEQNHVS
jgi:hypothetical protein